ncbi:hypothetical protein ACJX0J_021136, partial [Zea mays]
GFVPTPWGLPKLDYNTIGIVVAKIGTFFCIFVFKITSFSHKDAPYARIRAAVVIHAIQTEAPVLENSVLYFFFHYNSMLFSIGSIMPIKEMQGIFDCMKEENKAKEDIYGPIKNYLEETIHYVYIVWQSLAQSNCNHLRCSIPHSRASSKITFTDKINRNIHIIHKYRR